MATLDDKILGEKLQYYCSSSSSEGECDSDDNSNPCEDNAVQQPGTREVVFNEWEGSSTNTGPKGVIKDWQRYKQLETERREEQEQERLALIQKLSLTCQSSKDEELRQQREAEIEQEVQALLDDKILEEFTQKRMREMMSMHASRQPRFGRIMKLDSGQDFLDAIDKEKVCNVIIYIYREGDKLCRSMLLCFQKLAVDYPQVKFCSMEVSLAGMSKHFKQSGVPAVLVYNGGSLIGNFVRLTDELGEDFVTSDVENYLLEHGLLPDNSQVLSQIRSAMNELSTDE